MSLCNLIMYPWQLRQDPADLSTSHMDVKKIKIIACLI